MSVYKDAERNTWYVKFQYKNWEGKRKWITKRGFSTKRAATQWEREFELNQMESSDIPFDKFVQIYKHDRHPRIKESTFQTKENIIDTKIAPFLEKRC